MKLFFHIGTERTGSSYLQSLSAINRNVLKQNGIWFPFEGKKDIMMLKGEISPGNAQALTDALNSNNVAAFRSFVYQRVKEAKERKCHTLLLSNELLVLALAEENGLGQFISMLDRIDDFNISFLLFLREPVDQALSLYKHRAKNGKALDIEEWPKKHYVYGDALLSFLKQAQLKKICLSVRKFSKKNGVLENILFKEWLNVQEDLIPPPKFVNPSLNVSELILVKKLSEHQSYLASLLSAKLALISKKDKCENRDIVNYYKDTLSHEIANYDETWEICNQFLPLNEKISCSKANQPSIIDKQSSFSDQQIEAIVGFLVYSLTLKGRFQIVKLKFKREFIKALQTLKLINKA
jgi:hypothetical protein